MKFFFFLFNLLCSILFLSAFRLPKHYESYENARGENALEQVSVKVNGQSYFVASGKVLRFVKGDEIIIERAYLKSGKQVDYLNLVGYRNQSRKNPLDDSGLKIDSSVDLVKPYWALTAKKNRYMILATNKGRLLHGIVFLERQSPVLKYADITVNGEKRVMREGQTLIVKKTDKIKVVNYFTNFKDTKDMEVAIVGRKEKSHSSQFQVLFRHRGEIFARIPLVLEAL